MGSISRISQEVIPRGLPTPRKRGGAISNFYIHYEVDDDEGAAVLSLEAYGGDDESSWLLLEPVAE